MRSTYIIAHNPNTIDVVRNYLSRGANALEPDINIVSGTNKLCISHDEGDANTISIDDYFSQINDLLDIYPDLSLIYLDCKPSVLTMGNEILQSIRNNLGSKLKIIISVPSIKEAKIMFPSLISSLQDNEFLLIDEENDPIAVRDYFKSIGASRFGYGNGDSVPLLPTALLFPHIKNSVKQACQLRNQGEFDFVFTWTFNSKFNQKYFINVGVDGIIVDLEGFPCVPGLDNIKTLIKDKLNEINKCT